MKALIGNLERFWHFMNLRRLITGNDFWKLLLCILCDIVLSFSLLETTVSKAHPLPEVFFWEFGICFLVCLPLNVFLLRKCSSRVLNRHVVDLIHDMTAYFMAIIIAVNVFSACADGIALKSNTVKLLEYVLVFSVLCFQCAIEYKVVDKDNTKIGVSGSENDAKSEFMRRWGMLFMLIVVNVLLLLLVGKLVGWFDINTTIAGCKMFKSISPLHIHWLAHLIGLMVFAVVSSFVDWKIVGWRKPTTVSKAKLNVIVNGSISCVGYLVIICMAFSAINKLYVTIDSAMYEQAYYLLMLFFSIKVALTLSKY
ncbi:hypothetical protein ACLHIM_07035 [Ligilactobacillus sp. LYQ112]|uniref:hypothetical protein n=1 Tax=Ligilactobacillus sp. LYQ112 TaxID=3391060 RepID=UPI003983BE4F